MAALIAAGRLRGQAFDARRARKHLDPDTHWYYLLKNPILRYVFKRQSAYNWTFFLRKGHVGMMLLYFLDRLSSFTRKTTWLGCRTNSPSRAYPLKSTRGNAEHYALRCRALWVASRNPWSHGATRLPDGRYRRSLRPRCLQDSCKRWKS